MLEKILHVPIRDIRYSDDEKTMKFQYEGKGIRLDVYVADDKGTVYDIEMQVRKPSDDGLYLRTRYYQSMIDMGLLEEGLIMMNSIPVILFSFVLLSHLIKAAISIHSAMCAWRIQV